MEEARKLAVKITSQPSLPEFQAVVSEFTKFDSFHGRPSAATLAVYTAVLQSQLILVFQHDPAGVKSLVEIFSTPAGLGCLISRLNAGPPSEVSPIIRIVEKILMPEGIVEKLLSLDRLEVTNLIFGSRVLATVSAKPGETSWLGDVSAYSKWLARQMVAARNADARLFDRGVKLGAPQVYVAEYFATPLIPLLGQIFKQLHTSQQRFVISHALIQLAPSRPGQSSRLLLDLGVDPDMFTDICMSLCSGVLLIRAAVLLARHTNKLVGLVERIGKEWASRATIERKTLAYQQSMTEFLIAACASLDSVAAKLFAHSPTLTSGVSEHLSSTSSSIRSLGTLVAETFAKQAGGKLEFGITYTDYDWWIGVDKMDAELKLDSDGFSVDSDMPDKHTESPLADILNPPVRAADSDDEELDDDADSDEEVAPLFYIKDLIAYLRSDKYAEVQCALTSGASLILRKAEYGTEVSHYSEELLMTASGLTDKYSITDFAKLRQSILNSVVIANPSESGPTVVKLFVTGDWSLSQRQSLLAALVYAAHTLAENDPSSISQFEQLPGVLHRMFISPRDRIHQQQISDTSDGHISGEMPKDGQVIRRSKVLDNPKNTASAPAKNKFSEVSARFFYPLLAAQPPLRRSSYDSIVYAQWLRTLGVIVAEAYPSRHVPGMTTELWQLLKSLATSGERHQHHVIVIEEAIYSCLIMVIKAAGGVILQQYAQDIGPMFDAVARSVSETQSQSPEAQRSGRAALALLADLGKKVEENVLGS